MLSHISMIVSDKIPYEELQIDCDFRYTVDLLFHELLPFFKICFPGFSWLCFHISEWKSVASFHMKRWRVTNQVELAWRLTYFFLVSWALCSLAGLFLAMLSNIWIFTLPWHSPASKLSKLWQTFSNERHRSRDRKIDIDFFDFLGVICHFSINDKYKDWSTLFCLHWEMKGHWSHVNLWEALQRRWSSG